MKDELVVRFGKRDEQPIAISSASLIDMSDAQHVIDSVELDGYTGWFHLAGVPSGRYWLCAKIEGHPVLRFAIRIKGDADKTVSFVGRAPRCSSIVVEFVRRNDAKWHVHFMTIGMLPKHSAVVLVAGFDHHTYQGQPVDYSVYARQWRNDLYYGTTDAGPEPNRKIDRAIFEHTVVTTFNFATGYACEQIRGVKGWHTMYEFMCGTEPPHTANPHTEMELRKAAKSISITHVYEYLSAIGRDAPGSLAQLHFFSHGYSRGPILLNTDDDSKTEARDPGDKDPRYKDLFKVNINNHWPHLPDAFAADALVKSWGCFTDDYLRDQIEAVLHTKSMTEEVEFAGKMISRESVMTAVDDELWGSYVLALVDVFGLDAWGPAPGISASYKSHYMHVNQSEHGAVLRWYEKYFGGRRDVSGYYPYAKLKPKQEE